MIPPPLKIPVEINEVMDLRSKRLRTLDRAAELGQAVTEPIQDPQHFVGRIDGEHSGDADKGFR